jgi:hypothetical protein
LANEETIRNSRTPNPPATSDKYIVRVGDNYHFPEIDEYTDGFYSSYAEALVVCKEIVDGFLQAEYKPGMSAAALYGQYTSFGDDPYIIGDPSRFSAWDYAKHRCHEMCALPLPPSHQNPQTQ